MRGPITWRNVDAPDFSRGNLISSGVADIQSGLEGLQNILSTQARQQQQTWQQGKEANTLNALNQINHINSVDALNNTQAGDLINPYGAQVDAQAVMDALKGQRGVIAKDMQTEDAINGYTEKAKYGPIADQAALLIQQGRTKEAAPLLEQLKGTSYAEKLGGMVQQLDWHNQDQRLKQRELDIQAARYSQDKAQLDAAAAEDNMNNNAATYMRDLIVNKGMLVNDAKNQTLKKFGQIKGVNIGKLSQTLDSYSPAFQLSTADSTAIQGLKDIGKTTLDTGATNFATFKEGIAQKTGYNPAMQEQLDKWALKPNASVIGDGDGQMPKSEVDELNKTLASQNLSPLSVGEIAWLVQNPDSKLLGMGTEYKLNNVIQQRKAKQSYMEMLSDGQKLYNDWRTETINGLNGKIDLATRYALSPTSYHGAGNSVEEEKTILNNRVAALEAILGKTAGAPEREQQNSAEQNKLIEQNRALVDHIQQLSNENASLQSPAATRKKIFEAQAERRKEEKIRDNFATNYRPKSDKEWDMVRTALAANIPKWVEDSAIQLRTLNTAIDDAKKGDMRLFNAHFGNSMQKYALTLYDAQKAGKK